MALAQPLITPFVWGANGERMTPEEVARQRKVLDALMGRTDTSPVGHWTQGLARVVDAFGDKLQESRLSAAADKNATENKSILSALLGSYGGGSFPAAPGSPSFPETPLTAHAAEHGRDMSLAGGGSAYRDAIASIESAGSGDYAAVGPTHPKMGRALGRYQVMEANIGPWSQAALGRTVTPDEFLANPGIQDSIFDHVFGGYVKRFGPEGAAQAWFAGPGGVGKVDRKDSLGTNVGDYGQRFVKALGQKPVQVASLDPSIGLPDEQPQQTAGIFVGTPDELAASRLPAEGPIPQPVPVAQALQPQPVAPSPAPVQVAQALMPREAMSGAADAPMQAGGINPAIIQALTNPYADESTKRIAGALLQNQLEQQAAASDPMRALQMEKMRLEIDQARNPQQQYDFITGRDGSIFRTTKGGSLEQVYGGKPDLPTDVQEYQFAVSQGYQGTFADWQIENKKAGASQVNIDQRAEGAFEKKLAEGQAEIFNTMSSEGLNARSDLGVISELEGLLQGQGGAMSGLASIAAKYGVGGEGMSDLQAAQALINKLVPTQRQPGSGTMSDRDVELFTRSLPSLWNTPEGNQKIIRVMRGLAQYKQQQGEIADMVMMGEISRQEARKMLRELPNPLEEFRSAQSPQSEQKKRLRYNPDTGAFE